MDFTNFLPAEMIQPLLWLGRRDWVELECLSETRQISVRPKSIAIQGKSGSVVRPADLFVSYEEYKKYPREHWDGVRILMQGMRDDGIKILCHLTFSKALAQGPKLFKANCEQCEDLEATDIPFPFSEYHQPYQTFILEIPKEFKDRLAGLYQLPRGPSHVFCHKEEKIIIVTTFFDHNDMITNIIADRPEYATIEDCLRMNRRNRLDTASAEEWGLEFEASEIVQRLAINFGMYMTLIGVHTAGPLDPAADTMSEQMARSGNKDRSRRGKILQQAGITLCKFDQVVEFHTEERLPPRSSSNPTGETHRSPKPHRRRGHWRNQACGPKLAERRWIPIKPVMVRAWAFVGDESDTQVTYIPKE